MSLKNFATSFSNKPKYLRVSSYVIIAYLFYALIVGLLTPMVLQSQLPSLLSDKLERDVSIEQIRINPFLLRIRVSNFLIEEENSSERFVDVSLLEVDVGFWQTLRHFTPTLEHVFIVEPYVHLARMSGGESTQFNFSDIIASLSKMSPEQSQADKEKEVVIPHLRLGWFQLSGGHVAFSDKVTGTTIDYPKLAFELTELDTQADIINVSPKRTKKRLYNHYDFEVLTAEGGTVQFTGQFQLSPLEVKGNIELASIALAPLWPLSNHLIDANLTNGLFDLYLDYHLSEDTDSIRLRANNTQLTVSGLTIADDSQPKISIEGIHINGLNFDTDTQQVDISNIRIDKPWIDASFGKDGLDLLALLTPQTIDSSVKLSPSPLQAQGSNKPPRTEPSWRVVLQSFALNNGDINISESAISKGVHWRVFDVNATTGIVDTNFKNPIEYSLKLGLAGHAAQGPTDALGLLASKGEVSVNTQQVSGTVDFSQFALAQLQPYIDRYANVTLQEGLVGLSGTFAAGALSPIVFNGQTSVSKLTVLDKLKQEPLLQWQDMLVTGILYNSHDNALSLQKVQFDKPYTKLIIDQNKQTNISNILVQNASSELASNSTENADNSQPTPAPMDILIKEISVLDGSAYFEDNSLTLRFASGIEALNGSIISLSSKAGTSATVDLSGKIDGYAPVALKGAINPLIENVYLDLNFSVSGAELTSVNPYSGTYMGHFIDKGLLSLDVNYRLENNQLKGKNHVVIEQLTLGRKTNSNQALSLPIGLAIALLQDSNGVIDLGMEVSGDLNNPSFGFGSIIFKAFGNLITKAVTAPFSLLANLVGSDDELNEIPFSQGSSELNASISEKLITLAEALAKRPGLRVNIKGTVNKVSDAYELAEQKLQRQLLELSGQTSLHADFSASTMAQSGPVATALTTLFTTGTNKNVEQERQLVKAKLQQGDTKKSITDEQLNQALLIAMYNQIRNTIEVSQDDLTELAQSRATVVKTFLINEGNVDAKRLFLLNSRQGLQQDKSGVTLALEVN